jgi:hypothetical protein
MDQELKLILVSIDNDLTHLNRILREIASKMH